MGLLKDLLDTDGTVEYKERKFTTDNGIEELEGDIFVSTNNISYSSSDYDDLCQDQSSRIFILSMYRKHAIFVVCEVKILNNSHFYQKNFNFAGISERTLPTQIPAADNRLV